MAITKQINYQVNFNSNTSNVKNALANLQQTLNGITTKPITFDDGSITKAIQDAKELQSALQKATNVDTGKLNLTKFSQELKTNKKTLADYTMSLKQLGPQGQQAFIQMAQAIGKSEIALRKTNNVLTQMGITLKNTIRWQLSSSLIQGFTSAVSNAVRYTQDLDEALNNIRIVSDKNVASMEKFAERANQAAKDLAAGTLDYANASLIYYQQGLSDAQVKERTDATIKMANVTGEAAKEVSSYMTAIWNNFDDGSKKLEYYTDVMTALGAATAASTDEIATGLEKFAGIAETVGLSYEYATAAVTTLVDKTRQSPETIGTAMKTIFSRLQGLKLGETLDDGTDLNKYSEALATVGVNIKDQYGSLKKMDQILDDLGSKWNLISNDQQVALAQTLGGARQYTQIMSMMSNWDSFQDNVDIAKNAEGTLEKQQQIYRESWEAVRKETQASLEGLYSEIIPEETLIDFSKTMGSMADSLAKFIEGFGGIESILSLVTTMLVSKFLPSLMSGGQHLLGTLKSAFSFSNDLTLSFTRQAQEQLRTSGIMDETNSNYQQQLVNVEKILQLQEKKLVFAKSLTSEKKAQIDADIERLQKENAILEVMYKQEEASKTRARETANIVRINSSKSAKEVETGMEQIMMAASLRGTSAELGLPTYEAGVEEAPGFKKLSNLDGQGAKNWGADFTQRSRMAYSQQFGVSADQFTESGIGTALETKKTAEIDTASKSFAKLTGNEGLAKSLADPSNRPKDAAAIKNMASKHKIDVKALEKYLKTLGTIDKKYEVLTTEGKKLAKSLDDMEKAVDGIIPGSNDEQKQINALKNAINDLGDTAQSSASEIENAGNANVDMENLDAEVTKEIEATKTDAYNAGKNNTKNIQTDQDKAELAAVEEYNKKAEIASLKTDAITSSIQGVTTAFSSAAMMIQSIQSLGSIWSDENTTTGEKILSTVMAITMAFSSLTGIMQGIQLVEKGIYAWKLKQKMATTGLTAAEAAKALVIEKAQKKEEAGDKKAIIAKIAKGWAEAGPNYVKLATMAAVSALVLGLVGVGVAAAAGAFQKEEAKENTEQNFETADKSIQTAKENQKKLISYQEALNNYNEETGEGKEALAEQAEALAEAYNIEGAALAKLTGNYAAFNEEIRNAVRKENHTVVTDSDLAIDSLDQAIRADDLLEAGDGGDGADWFGIGQGTYQETFESSNVSDDIVNLAKENNLNLFGGSGKNFGITADNQAEAIWQIYKLRQLILEDPEKYGDSGKQLLKELNEDLQGIDTETLEKITTLFEGKQTAQLSNAYLNAEEQIGEVKTIGDYLDFKEEFMSQAASMKIANKEAKEYFNSLTQFDEIESLNTGFEELGIEDTERKDMLKEFYDEWGSMVFNPVVKPFLAEGSKEEITRQLDGISVEVDIVAKEKKQNALEQYMQGKISPEKLFEELSVTDTKKQQAFLTEAAKGNVQAQQWFDKEFKVDTQSYIKEAQTTQAAIDAGEEQLREVIKAIPEYYFLGNNAGYKKTDEELDAMTEEELVSYWNTLTKQIDFDGFASKNFNNATAKGDVIINRTAGGGMKGNQYVSFSRDNSTTTDYGDYDWEALYNYYTNLGYNKGDIEPFWKDSKAYEEWLDKENKNEDSILYKVLEGSGATLKGPTVADDHYKIENASSKSSYLGGEATADFYYSRTGYKLAGNSIEHSTNFGNSITEDLTANLATQTGAMAIKTQDGNTILMTGDKYQSILNEIFKASDVMTLLEVWGDLDYDDQNFINTYNRIIANAIPKVQHYSQQLMQLKEQSMTATEDEKIIINSQIAALEQEIKIEKELQTIRTEGVGKYYANIAEYQTTLESSTASTQEKEAARAGMIFEANRIFGINFFTEDNITSYMTLIKEAANGSTTAIFKLQDAIFESYANIEDDSEAYEVYADKLGLSQTAVDNFNKEVEGGEKGLVGFRKALKNIFTATGELDEDAFANFIDGLSSAQDKAATVAGILASFSTLVPDIIETTVKAKLEFANNLNFVSTDDGNYYQTQNMDYKNLGDSVARDQDIGQYDSTTGKYGDLESQEFTGLAMEARKVHASGDTEAIKKFKEGLGEDLYNTVIGADNDVSAGQAIAKDFIGYLLTAGFEAESIDKNGKNVWSYTDRAAAIADGTTTTYGGLLMVTNGQISYATADKTEGEYYADALSGATAYIKALQEAFNGKKGDTKSFSLSIPQYEVENFNDELEKTKALLEDLQTEAKLLEEQLKNLTPGSKEWTEKNKILGNNLKSQLVQYEQQLLDTKTARTEINQSFIDNLDKSTIDDKGKVDSVLQESIKVLFTNNDIYSEVGRTIIRDTLADYKRGLNNSILEEIATTDLPYKVNDSGKIELDTEKLMNAKYSGLRTKYLAYEQTMANFESGNNYVEQYLKQAEANQKEYDDAELKTLQQKAEISKFYLDNIKTLQEERKRDNELQAANIENIKAEFSEQDFTQAALDARAEARRLDLANTVDALEDAKQTVKDLEAIDKIYQDENWKKDYDTALKVLTEAQTEFWNKERENTEAALNDIIGKYEQLNTEIDNLKIAYDNFISATEDFQLFENNGEISSVYNDRMAAKIELVTLAQNRLTNAQKSYTEVYNKAKVDGVITNEEQLILDQAKATLLEEEAALVEAISAAYEELTTVIEKYNDEIDKQQEKLDAIVEITEAYISTLETLGERFNIGKVLQPEALQKLQETSLEMAITNVKVAKQQRDAQKSIVEQLDKQLALVKDNELQYNKLLVVRDEAASKLIETETNLASVMSESIAQATELFETNIDRILTTMKDALAGDNFGSLDELQTAYDRAEETSKRYLDTTRQEYELSKLRRTINSQINANTTEVANAKLRDILEDINKIEKDNLKMSEYDLKMLNAKYELYKAQIALEEAQNNKSQIRLQRNASGNWSYVFTADQGKIDQAAQKVEDAQYKIYNDSQQYLEQTQKNVLTLQQEWTAALEEIYKDATLSEEERIAKINQTNQYYAGQLSYFGSELSKTLNNTGIKFEDTIYGMITDFESFNEAQNEIVNSIAEGIASMEAETDKLASNIKDTMEDAGESFNTFGDKVAELANPNNENGLIKNFNTIANSVENMCTKIGKALEPVLTQLNTLTKVKTNVELPVKEITKDTENNYEEDYSSLISDYKNQYDTETEPSIRREILYAAQKSNKIRNQKIKDLELKEKQVTDEDIKNWFQGTAPAPFDTGGYTGDWGSEGKLAVLHEKELILNKEDTKKILSAVEIARMITGNALGQMGSLANAFYVNKYTAKPQELQQNVHIEASFPGVQSAFEIETALKNIVNDVSQYVEIDK